MLASHINQAPACTVGTNKHSHPTPNCGAAAVNRYKVSYIGVILMIRMFQMNEDDKNKAPKTSNMGLAIAMGAGIGIIFGEFIFDNVGIGIAIGTGIGIAFSSFNRGK
jgi:hypothetical protein